MFVRRFCAVLLTFAAGAAGAATNGLDTSFGGRGAVLIGPTPTSALVLDGIRGIAFQADGKIVIGGRSTAIDGPLAGHIQAAVGRLNSDGSWDTSFADHGLFILPAGSITTPAGGEVKHLAVFSDGSILAEGGSHRDGFGYLWDTCIVLIKLDSTGALSTGFGPGNAGSFCYDLSTPSNSRPSDSDGLAVAADDSFYVTSVTTLGHGAVAHFDSNGALVASYGSNGIAALPSNMQTYILNLTSENELLATGAQYFDSATSTQIVTIKLDSLGAIDSSYGANGVAIADAQPTASVSPTSASIDSSGNVLVTDNDYVSGNYVDYLFYRFTPFGSLDGAFNDNAQQPGSAGFANPIVSGNSELDYLVGARALHDGHIFAVGDAAQSEASAITNIALLRLNDDSSYDPSFGDAAHPGWASINIGVTGASNYADTFAIDADDHAVVSTNVLDSANHFCPTLLRVITDRLFSDQLDTPADAAMCPQ